MRIERIKPKYNNFTCQRRRTAVQLNLKNLVTRCSLSGDFYHLNLRYTAVISAVWAVHALKTIQPGCSRELRSNLATILATVQRED